MRNERVTMMIRKQILLEKEKLLNIAVFFALLAFSILIGWRYLHVGLYRDEGNWLFKASKILAGDVLYRDLLHPKPPGLFFSLIPLVLIGGTSIVRFRSFVLLLNSATAFLIFLIGRDKGRNRDGIVSSFLFVYLALHPRFLGFILMAENILNFLVTIIVYLLLIQSHNISKSKLYLVCGILASYATLIKQTGVFIIILGLLFILTLKESRDTKIKHISYFILGNFLSLIPFVVYLVYNGALLDAINQVILLLGTAVGEVTSLGARLYKLKYVGSKLYGIFAIFLIQIVSIRKFRRKEQVIGLWFLCSVIFTQLGPTTYNHHFLTIFPSLAIFAGMGFIRLIERIQNWFTRKERWKWYEIRNLTSVLLVVLIFICIIPLNILENEEGVNFLAYEQEIRQKQVNGHAYGGTLTYDEQMTVAVFLKQNGKSDEKIFVFKNE